jgi:sugar-specific transcriptional regulator TrmB
MDIRIFEELGLSAAEAKIYVALVERGPSKTGHIIDATKLQSSTVYHVLGSLVEKGLVSYIHEGKIKVYQAASPESLKSFIEEKQHLLDSILPELKEKEALSRTKLSARVFRGIKGLQAAYAEILLSMKRGEEYYFFQFPKKQLLNEHLLQFYRIYHQKRARAGIKVKGLAHPSTRTIITPIYKLPNTEIRYLDEFTPIGMVIYKNRIITIEWEETPVAFVIESESVAESYKKFFKQKWEQAKP